MRGATATPPSSFPQTSPTDTRMWRGYSPRAQSSGCLPRLGPAQQARSGVHHLDEHGTVAPSRIHAEFEARGEDWIFRIKLTEQRELLL